MTDRTAPAKEASAAELLPCPFGCEAHPYPAETARAYDRFAIYCPTCHVQGPRRDSLDGARDAWNRRSAAPGGRGESDDVAPPQTAPHPSRNELAQSLFWMAEAAMVAGETERERVLHSAAVLLTNEMGAEHSGVTPALACSSEPIRAGSIAPDSPLAAEREAVIEECARVAESLDRLGREWVPDSLWDKISRETAARIRALKSPVRALSPG